MSLPLKNTRYRNVADSHIQLTVCGFLFRFISTQSKQRFLRKLNHICRPAIRTNLILVQSCAIVAYIQSEPQALSWLNDAFPFKLTTDNIFESEEFIYVNNPKSTCEKAHNNIKT